MDERGQGEARKWERRGEERVEEEIRISPGLPHARRQEGQVGRPLLHRRDHCPVSAAGD